jgi:hypothetical protein
MPRVMLPPQEPQGPLPLPEVPQPVALPEELQEPEACVRVSLAKARKIHRHTRMTDRHLPRVMPPPQEALPLLGVPQLVALPQGLQWPGACG